jgi:hypothetical protein
MTTREARRLRDLSCKWSRALKTAQDDDHALHAQINQLGVARLGLETFTSHAQVNARETDLLTFLVGGNA